jgi:hypothetical protein
VCTQIELLQGMNKSLYANHYTFYLIGGNLIKLGNKWGKRGIGGIGEKLQPLRDSREEAKKANQSDNIYGQSSKMPHQTDSGRETSGKH